MAVAIIDNFEIININEKDGRGQMRVPFHLIHDALQPSQKQDSIWKAGEHIVRGVKK